MRLRRCVVDISLIWTSRQLIASGHLEDWTGPCFSSLSTARASDGWGIGLSSVGLQGRADTAQAQDWDHPAAQVTHEQCQPRDLRCHNTLWFWFFANRKLQRRGELRYLCKTVIQHLDNFHIHRFCDLRLTIKYLHTRQYYNSFSEGN